MGKNEFVYAKEDFILVSVPCLLGQLQCYAGLKPNDLKDVEVGQNEIFELAIINKRTMKFVLLRELCVGPARSVNDFVPKNSTGEFVFKIPQFEIPNKTQNLIFAASKEEIRFGLLLKTLVKINKEYLRYQIEEFQNSFTQKHEENEKLAHLERCRNKYLNFGNEKN